jgi:hypothetical protein
VNEKQNFYADISVLDQSIPAHLFIQRKETRNNNKIITNKKKVNIYNIVLETNTRLFTSSKIAHSFKNSLPKYIPISVYRFRYIGLGNKNVNGIFLNCKREVQNLLMTFKQNWCSRCVITINFFKHLIK